MTFKEQFSASEHKAHNRFIATKIHKELRELRAGVETSPTIRKRWVWELIQNAKDVNVGGKVQVRIEADLAGEDAHVIFRHNGAAFSPENIRFLIEQVSSKDRTTDSAGRPTTTGKFGTGFLTTYLLSTSVVVTGVANGQGLTPKRFQLTLDRSGVELDDIIAAVQAAKDAIQGLDDGPPYTEYVDGEFNTAFRYQLSDTTGRKVAHAGLADLDVCLPYSLAFVREIESIEYPNHLVSLQDPYAPRTDGEVKILSVRTTDPQSGLDLKLSSLAVVSSGLTTIAIPVEQTAAGVRILPLGPDVPRLFCDFPLLGTESFPFPVIINNPTLNPTDARDGLFLNQTELSAPYIQHNKNIIAEALCLHFQLLTHASGNGWQNLHLLAAARPIPNALTWVDRNWYTAEILKPIRNSILHTNIVRTPTNAMAPILSPDGKMYAWFPSAPTKELRRSIWERARWWFPHLLPALEDVEVWHDIIWEDCGRLTIEQLAAFIEFCDTIPTLTSKLQGRNVYEWLNEFYATLKLHHPDYLAIISKRRIFPSQNGTLKKKAELSRDAGNIEPALLDILKLLGYDLRDHLLAAEITTDLEDLVARDGGFVVDQITAALNKLIDDRKALDRYRPAVSELLLWFHKNPARAKQLFSILYENKHRLYDDEEILDNIKHADELKQLLNRFNVRNVDELQAVIEKQTSSSKVLPLTQEIIASLGITSIEEWKKALEDRNLAALFGHESTPTYEMFVYAQSLIQNAKDRVKAHLSTLDEYDLSEMDETAVTVLAGIKKDGRDVAVVVRPAYDGTVIIYYQSEKDVLDYEDHELWVDTGPEVRRVTFGHILKKTEIRRFPI